MTNITIGRTTTDDIWRGVVDVHDDAYSPFVEAQDTSCLSVGVVSAIDGRTVAFLDSYLSGGVGGQAVEVLGGHQVVTAGRVVERIYELDQGSYFWPRRRCASEGLSTFRRAEDLLTAYGCFVTADAGTPVAAVFPTFGRRSTCAAVKERVSLPSTSSPVLFLDPGLARSLQAQQDWLKSLPADWDGYGAASFVGTFVDAFVDELRKALRGYVAPYPDLVPGADGSLQAEWHLKDVELHFGVDADEQRYLYLKAGDGALETVYGHDAAVAFCSAIRLYLRSGDVQVAFVTAG